MKTAVSKDAPVLSKAEIYRRYPSHWILIVDPVSDKHLNLIKGKVVYHSKDRDEMYRKMLELRPSHFATLFTGKPHKDMEYVL
jgi:hypothetical protein